MKDLNELCSTHFINSSRMNDDLSTKEFLYLMRGHVNFQFNKIFGEENGDSNISKEQLRERNVLPRV